MLIHLPPRIGIILQLRQLKVIFGVSDSVRTGFYNRLRVLYVLLYTGLLRDVYDDRIISERRIRDNETLKLLVLKSRTSRHRQSDYRLILNQTPLKIVSID